MPRLLPRLIKELSKPAQVKCFPFTKRQRRRKSLYKETPPRPSLHPSNYTQSILLIPNNPITNSGEYIQHKSLPPQVRLPKNPQARRGEFDQARTMLQEERAWWASPYLRMLSSPIRQCIITGRYLPSDFLVRLAAMKVPRKSGGSRSNVDLTTVLIPDGLQHSKFTPRRSGRAVYILCLRDAVKEMFERGNHKRFSQLVHQRIAEQIAHLLRLRVLQELELLADQLEYQKTSVHHVVSPVIRRLSRQEWADIHQTGRIPHKGAVAVLVVPPLNKDTSNRRRPQPSMSAFPPDELELAVTNNPKPLSVLYPTHTTMDQPHPDYLPEARVPLYNGVTLFPSRGQRAALYSSLTRILGIEREKRNRLQVPSGSTGEVRDSRRASHAFLLISDQETILKGDIASIAIALWRVRMFEGGGRN